MNLTKATHVFHVDRWWNPAVEDQATDRTYRIGQKRNVQVHLMITAGTLKERIDLMNQEKRTLAKEVLAQSDEYLTNLSTKELLEIVSLRDSLFSGEDARGDERTCGGSIPSMMFLTRKKYNSKHRMVRLGGHGMHVNLSEQWSLWRRRKDWTGALTVPGKMRHPDWYSNRGILLSGSVVQDIRFGRWTFR